MHRIVTAAALAVAFAAPALAQTNDRVPGMQQMLQGLLSGNQNQDQAIRDAYERGYQRGREDEARYARDRGARARGSDDRGGGYGAPPPYPDDRGLGQPPGQGRGGYNR